MKLFVSYGMGSQGMAHYNVAVKRDLFSSPSFYADLQQSLEWAVTPYRQQNNNCIFFSTRTFQKLKKVLKKVSPLITKLEFR